MAKRNADGTPVSEGAPSPTGGGLNLLASLAGWPVEIGAPPGVPGQMPTGIMIPSGITASQIPLGAPLGPDSGLQVTAVVPPQTEETTSKALVVPKTKHDYSQTLATVGGSDTLKKRCSSCSTWKPLENFQGEWLTHLCVLVHYQYQASQTRDETHSDSVQVKPPACNASPNVIRKPLQSV